LLYVCQCALNEQPEAATEQQIGIHVFDRQPGYSPGEDNVVRSQARLLRWKLEQYFAGEGKDEPLIISIPKGQYLAVFEERPAVASSDAANAPIPPRKRTTPDRRKLLIVAATALLALAALGLPWIRSRLAAHVATAETSSPNPTLVIPSNEATEASGHATSQPAVLHDGAIRIAAGYSGPGFTDVWGRRWEADQYFDGGVAGAGPYNPFPPVADPRLFRTLRESKSLPGVGPPQDTVFAYNIPVPRGVYELRLYFADPNLVSDAIGQEDSQNTCHFTVILNGQRLLWNFDPVTDGTTSAVDIRVFKDVTPDQDGMVHLQFIPGQERPFVNAIELTPGTQGKLKPIRISAQSTSVVDRDGTRWSADDYFIHGRTIIHGPESYRGPDSDAPIPPFAVGERFGNFSYAIPVPPGSYTVKLYFAETFFGAGVTPGMCTGGTECRVFDVTCNGVMLLRDFDVYQIAGGAFKTVVRSFHGLHPNGQGKLLLTFTSTVNYAEVRAIEVLDEAK
jgi:hypothetical protein